MTSKPYLEPQPPRKLTIGISPWQNMRPKCLDPKRRCAPGIELEIVQMISKLLNFTFEFKISNLRGCGKKLENGSWSGLLGWLETKEINMTGNVCNIDESKSNETWLRASYPIFQHPQTFLIKAPKPVYEFRFSVLGPFHAELWTLLFFIGFCYLFFKVIYTRIILKIKFKTAIPMTIMNMFLVTFGMDGPKINLYWLMWISIVGFMTAVYSSFVKLSLLEIPQVERPFRDYTELADEMYAGKYKLVDYSNPASNIRCYDKYYCEKLADAVERNGFKYFNATEMYSISDQLLIDMVKHGDDVFVNLEIWTRLLLENFKDRNQLWLIKDHKTQNQLSAYLYRDDFEFGSLVNRALFMIGSYKDQVVKRYIGLSYLGTVASDVIMEDIPEFVDIGMQIMETIFLYYSALCSIAFVIFIIELIYFNHGPNKKVFPAESTAL